MSDTSKKTKKVSGLSKTLKKSAQKLAGVLPFAALMLEEAQAKAGTVAIDAMAPVGTEEAAVPEAPQNSDVAVADTGDVAQVAASDAPVDVAASDLDLSAFLTPEATPEVHAAGHEFVLQESANFQDGGFVLAAAEGAAAATAETSAAVGAATSSTLGEVTLGSLGTFSTGAVVAAGVAGTVVVSSAVHNNNDNAQGSHASTSVSGIQELGVDATHTATASTVTEHTFTDLSHANASSTFNPSDYVTLNVHDANEFQQAAALDLNHLNIDAIALDVAGTANLNDLVLGAIAPNALQTGETLEALSKSIQDSGLDTVQIESKATCRR